MSKRSIATTMQGASRVCRVAALGGMGFLLVLLPAALAVAIERYPENEVSLARSILIAFAFSGLLFGTGAIGATMAHRSRLREESDPGWKEAP